MADGGEGDDGGRRGFGAGYYILVGHTPVPERDLHVWAMWMDNIDKRRVGLYTAGSWQVSTVFLGINHNFSSKGPPLLFETMVFFTDKRKEKEGCNDVFMWRYDTWDNSLLGHTIATRTVNQIRSHILRASVWDQLSFDIWQK